MDLYLSIILLLHDWYFYIFILFIIMKKWVFWVFLFVLCVLAGCNNLTTDNTVEPTMESEILDIAELDVTDTDNVKSENASDYDQISKLYQQEWKITCTIESKDETLWNLISMIYIDWENVYQEIEVEWDTDSLKIYSLILNGKNYSRWDLYWEWNGFVVDEEQTIEQILSAYDAESQDENTNINCIAWIEWANFEVPNSVEFIDLNSYTDVASYTE